MKDECSEMPWIDGPLFNERDLVFYRDNEGRYWAESKTAHRAFRHYGFLPPLDPASFLAFENILRENWSVSITEIGSPFRQPFQKGAYR